MAIRQAELAWCWAQRGRPDEALQLLQRIAHAEAAVEGAPAMIYILSVQGQVQLQLRQPQAASLALTQAAQLALRHEWLSLVLPALLPMPQAWLCSGQAEPAALLFGHLLANWPANIGRFNPTQARSNRRTRRLLTRVLGQHRCAELLRAGGQLSRDAALQLLLRPAQALAVS